MRAELRAATTGEEGRLPSLRGLAVNLVVCFTIAVMIQLLVEDGWFIGTLFISCSIGFSIYLSIWLAFRLLSPRVPAIVLVVSGMGSGLVIGLVLTGLVLYGEPLLFLRGTYEVLALGVLFGALATAGFVVVGDVWDVRARLARAEREALARDKLLAEAELRVLQAQIEPHFLFNTLANVVSLVDTDPERAKRLLERLTSLLRTSLARTRTEAVTLGAELAIVRDYLEIQALRMEDRLHYEMDVEPGLDAVPVAPLLVQPLVENAIQHGVEGRAEGGRVCVRVQRVMDAGDAGQEIERVEILVEDDGVGLDASAPAGTGLANVRKRLLALHGDRARLRVTEAPGGGVRALISLPLDASA